MRRTSSQTDTRDAATLTEGGATGASTFDRAYARLVRARTDYDRFAGDADHIAELAEASRALHEARAIMAAHRGI